MKSKREKASEDQIVYFGQKDMTVKQHNQICDIMVNTDKKPSEYGAHFFIKYDWEFSGYYMKDLNKGTLIQYTLQDCQQIHNRMTVQFGNTILMLRARTVLPTKQDQERSAMTQSIFSNYQKMSSITNAPNLIHPKAKSEKLSDPNLYELSVTNLSRTEINQCNYTFVADCGEIKVGRGVDTDVRVNDPLSSKIQFTLFFTNGDWYISNGYKSRMPSNPSWILLTGEAPIWNKTKIKYNDTIFEANLQKF